MQNRRDWDDADENRTMIHAILKRTNEATAISRSESNVKRIEAK